MEEIIENLKSVQMELEIKAQEYTNAFDLRIVEPEDNTYFKFDDRFFEFYPKNKPFQVEIGRIKKTNS